MSLGLTSGSVVVSWQAPTTGGAPAHYVVKGNGGVQDKTVGANVFSVTFTGLKVGQMYTFEVSATNAAGESEPVQVTATPL